MNKHKNINYFYIILSIGLIVGFSILLSFLYSIVVVYPFSANIVMAISVILYSITSYFIIHGIVGLKFEGNKNRKNKEFKLNDKNYLILGISLILVCSFVLFYSLFFYLSYEFIAIHDYFGYTLTHIFTIIIIGALILYGLLGYKSIKCYKLIKSNTPPNQKNRKKPIKEPNEYFTLRKLQILGVFVIIGASGLVGIVTMIFLPECYWGTIGFSDPAYTLPSGAHENTDLDLLTGENQTILQAIEKGLWAITKLRQQGGFPMWVETDGSKFYSDREFGCPLFPGEFSLQEGTALLAGLYLKMYQIENNSIYLGVAEDAGDALIAVQDEINGGFYYDGRRFADGTGYQPHPKNYMRSAILDDNVLQSCLDFLLDLYNVTGTTKYKTAFEKGFQCLLDVEKPHGGWIQRSNYPNNMYFSYVTLNDNTLLDVVRVLLKAYDIFPAESKYLVAAQRGCQFLLNVQGNGGSTTQLGWAQQYSDDDLPAWARDFEPPAICSLATVSAMTALLEMYLATNDTKWIDPIPNGITWLDNSKISWVEDGVTHNSWSRLYELGTNTPIYGKVLGRGRSPEYGYEPTREGYGWRDDFGVTAFKARYNLLDSLGKNITEFNLAEANVSVSSALSVAQSSMNIQTADGFWLNSEKIRAGNCAAALTNMMNYIDLIV